MCVFKFQMLVRLTKTNFKVDIELCFSFEAQKLMSHEHIYDATGMTKGNLFNFDEAI